MQPLPQQKQLKPTQHQIQNQSNKTDRPLHSLVTNNEVIIKTCEISSFKNNQNLAQQQDSLSKREGLNEVSSYPKQNNKNNNKQLIPKRNLKISLNAPSSTSLLPQKSSPKPVCNTTQQKEDKQLNKTQQNNSQQKQHKQQEIYSLNLSQKPKSNKVERIYIPPPPPCSNLNQQAISSSQPKNKPKKDDKKYKYFQLNENQLKSVKLQSESSNHLKNSNEAHSKKSQATSEIFQTSTKHNHLSSKEIISPTITNLTCNQTEQNFNASCCDDGVGSTSGSIEGGGGKTATTDWDPKSDYTHEETQFAPLSAAQAYLKSKLLGTENDQFDIEKILNLPSETQSRSSFKFCCEQDEEVEELQKILSHKIPSQKQVYKEDIMSSQNKIDICNDSIQDEIELQEGDSSQTNERSNLSSKSSPTFCQKDINMQYNIYLSNYSQSNNFLVEPSKQMIDSKWNQMLQQTESNIKVYSRNQDINYQNNPLLEELSLPFRENDICLVNPEPKNKEIEVIDDINSSKDEANSTGSLKDSSNLEVHYNANCFISEKNESKQKISSDDEKEIIQQGNLKSYQEKEIDYDEIQGKSFLHKESIKEKMIIEEEINSNQIENFNEKQVAISEITFEIKGKDGLIFEFQASSASNISNEFDLFAIQHSFSEEEIISVKIGILSYLQFQTPRLSAFSSNEEIEINQELERITLIHALNLCSESGIDSERYDSIKQLLLQHPIEEINNNNIATSQFQTTSDFNYEPFSFKTNQQQPSNQYYWQNIPSPLATSNQQACMANDLNAFQTYPHSNSSPESLPLFLFDQAAYLELMVNSQPQKFIKPFILMQQTIRSAKSENVQAQKYEVQDKKKNAERKQKNQNDISQESFIQQIQSLSFPFGGNTKNSNNKNLETRGRNISFPINNAFNSSKKIKQSSVSYQKKVSNNNNNNNFKNNPQLATLFKSAKSEQTNASSVPSRAQSKCTQASDSQNCITSKQQLMVQKMYQNDLFVQLSYLGSSQ